VTHQNIFILQPAYCLHWWC